jgi:hypothetical protein
MGLETVEIVLDIEDRFKISIPDAAASQCNTVIDLQREVIKLLEQRGREAGEQLDREVWEGIVAVIVKQTGIPASKIRPESKWIGDITRNG